MPLPVLLGIAFAAAGAAGIGSGIRGAKKVKDANDTIKSAQNRHERNISRFELTTETTSKQMEKLGKFELEILHSFEEFSLLIEKIQNKPEFKEVKIDDVELPEYDGEKIKEVSVTANVLLSGLGSATIGSGVTAAISASGGAIAAGGGGIALGTTILGATTLGVGLLVGGVIFNITGGKLSQKADEAYDQMRSSEKKIDKACEYLNELSDISKDYYSALTNVNEIFKKKMQILKFAINTHKKLDWNEFSDIEKKETQNLVLLVGLLFKMCQVNLVLKSENDSEINKVNTSETKKMIKDSQVILSKIN